MAAGVAWWDRPWVGWISLIPLFAAIRVLPPRQSMLCGAFWGIYLSFFLAAFIPGIIGVSSLVLLAAVPAAYTYAAALVTRRVGFSPLFLGFGWVLVELALQPLGLGRGLLAGTQGHGGLVDWVSGLLGSTFVAFVVAAGNATLLLVFGALRFNIDLSPFLMVLPHRLERLLAPVTTCHLLLDDRPAQPRAPPV